MRRLLCPSRKLISCGVEGRGQPWGRGLCLCLVMLLLQARSCSKLR